MSDGRRCLVKEYDQIDKHNLIKDIEQICLELKILTDSIHIVDVECDNQEVKNSILTAHNWLHVLLSELESDKYTMYKEFYVDSPVQKYGVEDKTAVTDSISNKQDIRDKMSQLLSDTRDKPSISVTVNKSAVDSDAWRSVNSIGEFNKLLEEFYKNNPNITYDEYMSWCMDMATKISNGGGFARLVLQEALKPKN